MINPWFDSIKKLQLYSLWSCLLTLNTCAVNPFEIRASCFIQCRYPHQAVSSPSLKWSDKESIQNWLPVYRRISHNQLRILIDSNNCVDCYIKFIKASTNMVTHKLLMVLCLRCPNMDWGKINLSKPINWGIICQICRHLNLNHNHSMILNNIWNILIYWLSELKLLANVRFAHWIILDHLTTELFT